METRPLGDSGLTVTPLGLGLAALGRPAYITLGHAEDLARRYDVAAMERHAHAVLDAAWSAGVRYFDAARSYGRAEDFLGSWLRARGIAPNACTVGSKWGYIYTGGWRVDAEVHEVKDHTLLTLRRQFAESWERLDGYLDLYQIHSATEDSGVLDRAEVLDELARLKAGGHVRAIGLTLSGPDSARTLERASAIERDGQPLFDTVQATWNLLEPSLGPLLAHVRALGMGVLVKEALANGRLTPRSTAPDFAANRAVLEREAARLGCTIDQLALAAVLEQPWADCVLSGAATVEQLRSNVGALQVRLDAAARAALATLAEPPARYWATRAALRWQ
ncbi:MAG: aldo/keto reductase [Sphaerobacter sp.]|nr:aldo/keto reductase [Sphaerobacter sp.]